MLSKRRRLVWSTRRLGSNSEPGGMRLGGDSIDAVSSRAAQWGWEPTDSGLRLWACLLSAGATDTGSSPGTSDLPPAAA